MKYTAILLIGLSGCFTESGDITGYIQGQIQSCYEGQKESCLVKVPAGNHTISETIKLCGPVEISGEGEYFTSIKTTGTFNAFWVQPYEICREKCPDCRGKARIEKMDISGMTHNYPVLDMFPATHGVLAEHRFTGYRLIVHGFAQNIRITASVTRSPKSNANNWRLDEVRLYDSEHSALAVTGGDTNVGLATAIDIFGNTCTFPEKYEYLGGCAGIHDYGFLGSTYIATHVSDTKGYPAYEFDNVNSRHAVIGAYSEIGETGVSFMERHTAVIGGLGLWKGKGLRLEGIFTDGLVVRNLIDNDNQVQLRLGGGTGVPGTFLGFQSWMNSNKPLYFKTEPNKNSYRFDIGNLGSTVGLRVNPVTGQFTVTSSVSF